MPKRRQLRSFDLKKIEGFESLIGVDEVGRGALAGPVVAGAQHPGEVGLGQDVRVLWTGGGRGSVAGGPAGANRGPWSFFGMEPDSADSCRDATAAGPVAFDLCKQAGTLVREHPDLVSDRSSRGRVS